MRGNSGSGFFQGFGSSRARESALRNRLRSQIHCLRKQDSGLIFIKDSISLLTAPLELLNALQAFLQGDSGFTAAAAAGVDRASLNTLLSQLSSSAVRAEAEADPPGGRILDRLVLNVSQTCNLDCRYCYAGGGDYRLERTMMSRETALAAVHRFCSEFDGLDKVQFFGGEPFLRPEIIGLVCDEFNRLFQAGGIARLPEFFVVTNGTLISDEILSLIKKHNLALTISLDGPPEINDFLRGPGVSAKIVETLPKLEAIGAVYSFEGTFTKKHLDLGFSLNRLLEYFRQELGQGEVHIPPVSAGPGDALALEPSEIAREYGLAVERSIHSLAEGGAACLSFATRVMDVFTTGQPVVNYCPAGRQTISVAADGGLYPCFMFTGQRDFLMGHVLDRELFHPPAVDRVLDRLMAADKAALDQCRACWAEPFCSGCFGADQIVTGQGLEKYNCLAVKAMAEAFLLHGPDLLKSENIAGQASG